jgi:hypothetical protein
MSYEVFLDWLPFFGWVFQLIAVPFYVISFWFNKRNLLSLQFLCNICFALAYLFSGSLSGCIATIATLPLLVTLRLKNLRIRRVTSCISYALMVVFSIILNLVILSDYHSFIMIIGIIVYGSALTFVPSNNSMFKILAASGHLFFVVFEVSIGAYILAVMDGLTILSILLAWLKSKRSEIQDQNESNA